MLMSNNVNFAGRGGEEGEPMEAANTGSSYASTENKRVRGLTKYTANEFVPSVIVDGLLSEIFSY
jgi:hypothetical protein